MLQYIVKRLLLMAVTLFGITVITFLLTRLTPGDPVSIAQRPATSQGGFEEQLEANRRNLGLDKPWFFNTRFEDRNWLARQGVEDLSKPVLFWQNDARKRLRLAGTITLGPALDYLEELEKVQGRVDHTLRPVKEGSKGKAINVEESRQRLLDLLPSLAKETPPGLDKAAVPSEQLAAWRAWYEANRGRWSEAEVSRVTEEYLSGTGSVDPVLKAGGFAVPHLMEGLDSGDPERMRRANEALTGTTGFDFMAGAGDWEKGRGEVVRKWNSFYSRERIRFCQFNKLQHTVNFFANTQFGIWARQVLIFDFGQSFKHKTSVNRLILERIPITIVMSMLSIFFSYLIAIPLGIFSAVKKNTPTDRLVTVVLFILYSLPSFWVAQMLLMTTTGGPMPLGGGEWPTWFPRRGVNGEGLDWMTGKAKDVGDMLWHLVLPTICLTYGSLAFLSRQMRGSMLEVIKLDYVRTAVAKGLHPRAVIFKHVLRNSLIPILTLSAGLLPELIAGSIITEQIFTIPGMGLLSFEAILNRDYPVVNAILFFSAALTLIGILLADLSYVLVDPRITYD